MAALAERGVAVDGGRKLVGDRGVSGRAVYDQIRDALVEADAPLRRLAPQRRTLSELFEPREANDRGHGVSEQASGTVFDIGYRRYERAA